jgi:hypothetical protein
MKYFKVNYTIYNMDGSIRKTGTICKIKKGIIKRMKYLEELYLGRVKFH